MVYTSKCNEVVDLKRLLLVNFMVLVLLFSTSAGVTDVYVRPLLLDFSSLGGITTVNPNIEIVFFARSSLSSRDIHKCDLRIAPLKADSSNYTSPFDGFIYLMSFSMYDEYGMDIMTLGKINDMSIDYVNKSNGKIELSVDIDPEAYSQDEGYATLSFLTSVAFNNAFLHNINNTAYRTFLSFDVGTVTYSAIIEIPDENNLTMAMDIVKQCYGML